MKKKFTTTIITLTLISLSIYGLVSYQQKKFISEFIKNVNNPNFENGNGQFIDYITIGEHKVYWTSADSCGNSTDNFDLCAIYLPDKSIYTEESKHYCGYESTIGVIRRLKRKNLAEFIVALEESGFKKSK